MENDRNKKINMYEESTEIGKHEYRIKQSNCVFIKKNCESFASPWGLVTDNFSKKAVSYTTLFFLNSKLR